MNSRRTFLKKTILLTGSLSLVSRFAFGQSTTGKIMTVKGLVAPEALGNTLIHEHILVDFIGAAEITPDRWDRSAVMAKVIPELMHLKAAGGKTLVDCTPNYLGRDVTLLKELSTRTGLNILTNTGYYGGSDNKFLPEHTFQESEQQLATRWIQEWNDGIDGTGIKPGFIKISVNDGSLSAVSKKLIKAAALTHLQTGLTIASHTGPYLPAKEQLDILKEQKVDPSAFIWVHAQNEEDWNHYKTVAKSGAWVSLDGLSDGNLEEYQERLLFMKNERCLHRTLISHDAGWYDPAKEDGGNIRGYTTLFKKFIPLLRSRGFNPKEIEQLIRKNPQEVFQVRVRK